MNWLLRGVVGAGVVAAGVASTAIARQVQRKSLVRLELSLRTAARRSREEARIDVAALERLPPPVARYLELALADAPARIRLARLSQDGRLRTELDSERWTAFEATQLVAPAAPGFVWDARVGLAPLVHVRVRDAFVDGHGVGQVLLASAVAVASAPRGPELDAASLQRYLAEAVWYPTALMPSDRLSWQPVDERTARATITAGSTTVSLDFRFGGDGLVLGVHAPSRWAHFGSGFRAMPWEGRFTDYQSRAGFVVPLRAEAAWHDGDTWQPVWRGHLTGVAYEM